MDDIFDDLIVMVIVEKLKVKKYRVDNFNVLWYKEYINIYKYFF